MWVEAAARSTAGVRFERGLSQRDGQTRIGQRAITAPLTELAVRRFALSIGAVERCCGCLCCVQSSDCRCVPHCSRTPARSSLSHRDRRSEWMSADCSAAGREDQKATNEPNRKASDTAARGQRRSSMLVCRGGAVSRCVKSTSAVTPCETVGGMLAATAAFVFEESGSHAIAEAEHNAEEARGFALSLALCSPLRSRHLATVPPASCCVTRPQPLRPVLCCPLDCAFLAVRSCSHHCSSRRVLSELWLSLCINTPLVPCSHTSLNRHDSTLTLHSATRR